VILFVEKQTVNTTDTGDSITTAFGGDDD